MGQKTHPIGIRLGIIKTWNSKWYAKKNYKEYLIEDLTIQKHIKTKLFHAGVPKIEIERTGKKVKAIVKPSTVPEFLGSLFAAIAVAREKMGAKQIACRVRAAIFI